MDQPIFKASEVLEMAIRIEHQGLAFYKTILDAAMSDRIADVLRYLIEQEQQHIQVFTKMKKGLEDYRLPESYPGESRNYADSFVRGRVFDESERASKEFAGMKDPFRAIDYAVEFEERSILFYSWIKQVVHRSEGEAIERVIGEEHDHIRRLFRLREELEYPIGSAR